MNAELRTLPLPSAVQPIRERGASALDRSTTAWAAPVATARILDRWGMPVREEFVTWPAPDPVMRFDLPAPDSSPTVDELRWSDLVDPTHPVAAPDLELVALEAIASRAEVANWPAPELGTAVSAEPERTRNAAFAIVGLAAVATAIVAGTAAIFALF